MSRNLDKADAEFRRLTEVNTTLLEALKIIAEGPWPEDIDGPEKQCRFDADIARAAIARSNEKD